MTARSWRGTWRIATEPQRTSDEYAVWLLTLLQHAGLKRTDITAAVIGTVVPAALYHLRRLVRDWFDVEPLIARATLDWGFDIKVDNPEEVGADRLLNALAGHRNYRRPAGGDRLRHRHHLRRGGRRWRLSAAASSRPGINLSIEALHRAAARLPRIGIGRPQAVIGTNTVAAMQSGIYWGYVAMIEGLVARIQAEYRRPAEGHRHRRAGAAARRGHRW